MVGDEEDSDDGGVHHGDGEAEAHRFRRGDAVVRAKAPVTTMMMAAARYNAGGLGPFGDARRVLRARRASGGCSESRKTLIVHGDPGRWCRISG